MSTAAADILARAHGYTLVYVMHSGINCLMLRNDLLTPLARRHLTFDLVFPALRPGLHSTYSGSQPWLQVCEWTGTEGGRWGREGAQGQTPTAWLIRDSCHVLGTHEPEGKGGVKMRFRPVCAATYDLDEFEWVGDRDWPLRGFSLSEVRCDGARGHGTTASSPSSASDGSCAGVDRLCGGWAV
jgi:hypothetical protein